MDWKQLYKEKLLSLEDAAQKIKSGDKVFMGTILSAPTALMEAIADRVDELENVDLISGLLMHPFKFLQDPKFIGRINYTTYFLGPYERAFSKVGNVNVSSVQFSKLPRCLAEDVKPNVMIADVSLPDEEGYVYWGVCGALVNGFVAEFDSMDTIIIQVNKHQPKTKGQMHRIHISQVTHICESDCPLPQLPEIEITETDKKIADIMVPLVPDGAGIQIGIGGLANAIGYGLESKKDLYMHTEMVTDSLTYLCKKGVIKGKKLAAFALGSQETYDYVGEGNVEIVPLYISNEPEIIGQNDNFISINSALMADLTGQICSESIGFRQYSSTGGSLDFCRGAAKSKGGQSFFCMPSTVKRKDGEIKSTIDVALPLGGIVTIPRTDTMNIVTEYGVANLHNRPIPDRVEAMISIAHPDFRDHLRAKAKEVGII